MSISFGIFLFILFFQPFSPLNFSFNNTLLFVGGMAAIIFIFIVLIRSIIPWILNENVLRRSKPFYAQGFALFLVTTLTIVFYLWIVGKIPITFFIIFKVMLICLGPPLFLRFYDKTEALKNEVRSLHADKNLLKTQVEKFEDDYLNKTIEFKSENINENFSIHISELVFIRSADNYVEIFFKDGPSLSRKLLRNTLRNMELQIKPFSFLIRCHRICIVNTHYIEKLNRSNNSYSLKIKGYEVTLPVSRQYLIRLKEVLSG